MDIEQWGLNRVYKEWELRTLSYDELMRLIVRIIDHLSKRLSGDDGWIMRDITDIQVASKNLEMIEKIKAEK